VDALNEALSDLELKKNKKAVAETGKKKIAR
jgi:hypothetical protein